MIMKANITNIKTNIQKDNLTIVKNKIKIKIMRYLTNMIVSSNQKINKKIKLKKKKKN